MQADPLGVCGAFEVNMHPGAKHAGQMNYSWRWKLKIRHAIW